MAITNTTLASPTYNGNGSTTAFATGFQFIANADLLVTVTGSSGVETVKTLTTHYTVTGAGNSGGGTVTMLTAPASGEKLNIQSNVTLDQQTDYVEGGSFAAATHETALDKLTKITQQIQEQVDRSITVPISNQSFDTSIGVVTANYILGSNGAATALEWKSPATIALGTTVSAFAETLLDDTTAATARTTLGLGTISTFNDADPNADRIVFWDDSAGSHAYLTAGTGLTITGTTMTATSGAMDITGLSAIGAAVDGANDEFPLYDASAAANKKITFNNIITALTEDTTPDTANDLVMTYDSSATNIKKVKLSNLGTSTAATQSDQETGTSTTTYVSPGRQQYHASSAKAWVLYTSITTTAVIGTASYNISSLTDNGTGDTTVNFTTSFSGANAYTGVFCSDVTEGATANDSSTANSHTRASGSHRITTPASGAGSLIDHAYIGGVWFGDQ